MERFSYTIVLFNNIIIRENYGSFESKDEAFSNAIEHVKRVIFECRNEDEYYEMLDFSIRISLRS